MYRTMATLSQDEKTMVSQGCQQINKTYSRAGDKVAHVAMKLTTSKGWRKHTYRVSGANKEIEWVNDLVPLEKFYLSMKFKSPNDEQELVVTAKYGFDSTTIRCVKTNMHARQAEEIAEVEIPHEDYLSDEGIIENINEILDHLWSALHRVLDIQTTQERTVTLAHSQDLQSTSVLRTESNEIIATEFAHVNEDGTIQVGSDISMDLNDVAVQFHRDITLDNVDQDLTVDSNFSVDIYPDKTIEVTSDVTLKYEKD